MKKIRVVLADDHQVVRSGLRLLLAEEPDIEVVGEATDGGVTMDLVDELKPDVVVMDISMPGLDGQEATRRISTNHPAVRVVVLSTYSDASYIQQLLQAGALGYVGKAAASEELLQAIRAASHGQSYLSPALRAVLGGDGDGTPHVMADRQANAAIAALGRREREVLQLLATGLSSRQIGLKLCISVKTVDTHRRNIRRKLNLHSTADLVKAAMRAGLVSLDRDAGD